VTKSVLVALNDSMSSRAVVDYLLELSLRPEDFHVTLLHIFRQAPAGEQFMGESFTQTQESRLMAVLKRCRDKLVENGFSSERIEIKLVTEDYKTVADGIIDQFRERNCDMVVIGRKRLSKAEEFVLGDISVKLVRAIEGAGVLVVKAR
jgi:nucleotide-binding universal stress UspA family protein